MAITQKENLKIPQGSTYSHTFHYRDKTTGAIIDLTGYTGRMEIRASVDDAVVLYDSTIFGDITINGSQGDVILEIPSSVTKAWTWLNAVYDLEIVSGSSKVTRLVMGTVVISREVTR
ncbi:MAG: hypothetical protein ACREA9_19235 [Pyrinomonadaceae bacterium]